MAAALPAAAQSPPGERTPEPSPCYDAIVSAELLRQTPTPIPRLDDGSIVMSWPWILQLRILRVVRGAAPLGDRRVLSIQHTWWTPHEGPYSWWLRRNTDGGFNVVTFARSTSRDVFPDRCPLGTPPAQAYLTLDKGQTLRDVARGSDQAWAR